MIETYFKHRPVWRRQLIHAIKIPQARQIAKPKPAIWIIPHYSDVMMSAMTSQITGVSIVCSTVCADADQRKHQSSMSLAFERGIHRRIPLAKGQLYGNYSHLMTLSCNWGFVLDTNGVHDEQKKSRLMDGIDITTTIKIWIQETRENMHTFSN